MKSSTVTGFYVLTSQVNALTRIEITVVWVSRLCSVKCSKVQILHWDKTKPDCEILKSFVKWAFSSQPYYWIISVRECLSVDSASDLYLREVWQHVGYTWAINQPGTHRHRHCGNGHKALSHFLQDEAYNKLSNLWGADLGSVLWSPLNRRALIPHS